MCVTPLDSDLAAHGDEGLLGIRREMSGAILITGGLGFLGSVVLEQLLRLCPQVREF
jgi:hypothetical protein